MEALLWNCLNILPQVWFISDIMMPDMDGLELCQIIKNNSQNLPLAILLFWAPKARKNKKSEGYEAGADAYIPKTIPCGILAFCV